MARHCPDVDRSQRRTLVAVGLGLVAIALAVVLAVEFWPPSAALEQEPGGASVATAPGAGPADPEPGAPEPPVTEASAEPRVDLTGPVGYVTLLDVAAGALVVDRVLRFGPQRRYGGLPDGYDAIVAAVEAEAAAQSDSVERTALEVEPGVHRLPFVDTEWQLRLDDPHLYLVEPTDVHGDALRGGLVTRRVDAGIACFGRVVDPDGAPVAGVAVLAVNFARARGYRPDGFAEALGMLDAMRARCAVTGVDGRFRLEALNADRKVEILCLHPEWAVAQVDVPPQPPYTDFEVPDVTLSVGSRLRVRVLSLTDGVALGGARVSVRGGPGGDMGTSGRRTEQTDQDGSVEFARLAAGKYRVRIDLRGYAPVIEHVVIEADADSEQIVRIAGGRVASGRVVDAVTDAPVVGAKVRAQARHLPLRDAGEKFARTDEQGRFEFEAAPAESLKFTISHPGYVTLEQRVGPRPDAPTLRLVPEAGISVHLVGEPVEGEWSLRVSAESGLPRTQTVASGTTAATVRGFAPGERVELFARGELVHGAMTIDAVVDGMELALPMERTPLVSGVVTDTRGVPLEGVRVRVVDSAFSLPGPLGLIAGAIEKLMRGEHGLRTDDGGRFAVHVAPAQGRVLAFEREGYTEASHTLSAPPYQHVRQSLQRLPAVEGVVRGVAGEPLQRVNLVQLSESGRALAAAETDAEGAFLVYLRPDTHALRVFSGAQQASLWSQLIEAPAPGRLDLQAPTATAGIRVQIDGPMGNRLTVTVRLLDRLGGATDFARPSRTARLQETRTHTFERLLPGRYIAEVKRDGRRVARRELEVMSGTVPCFFDLR